MKGKKYRYDEKKLSKNTSLKKRMALYLATEFIKISKDKLDLPSIVAFGLTQRPYISYSDKELIKLFDASYANKFDLVEQRKKEQQEYIDTGNRRGWMTESYARAVKDAQDEIANMQPMIDELLEEAFSE